MSFQEEVYKTRRIVLVQFGRPRNGSPRYSYPDLDDRGWLHDPAGTRGETPAEVHGPVLGMQQNREVFVKCDRMRLEAEGSGGPALYLNSEDTSVVTIVDPASGGVLPADGKFKIKGGTGAWRDKFACLTIRLNSTSGPIIGEMGVRVFRPVTLNLQPWMMTINGRNAPGGPLVAGATATNAARITTLTNVAKRIWRQCGIRLNVRAPRPATLTLNVPGQITENSGAATINTPGGAAFPAGSDDSVPVHTANRQANACNIWWVQRIGDLNPAAGGTTMAWAIDKNGSAAQSGIVMTDGADGNDLAHEIGHFLTLDHSDVPASGPNRSNRVDFQILRRLMYRFNPHGRGGFRSNVGYGSGLRGALLTMRDKPKHSCDDEWFETRRHIINGPY